MPSLNVYFSNQLEPLAEKLAHIVRTPLTSALTPETLIVQSRGMERWLSMALAEHNGISANCRFPFPNAFLNDLFKQIMPDLPEVSPWDPDILSFIIMKLLPEHLERPEFRKIKAYLKHDANRLKLFQLSDRIADLFDQYLVFRPELIFRWEEDDLPEDEDQRWQASLWQKLVEINGNMHRARQRKKIFDHFSAESADISNLPQRVCVFGTSYIPLFHLETFAVLSSVIPVNFFLLNPCREYWADIVSEKQHQRIRKQFPETDDIAAELHFEEGNRLLASMGNLGQDFFRLLGNFEIEFHDLFHETPGHHTLSYIQSDILKLRNREPAGPTRQPEQSHVQAQPEQSHVQAQPEQSRVQAQPEQSRVQAESVQISERDNSIQVHSCHSPMREIEVLQDNLLAFFEEDPKLLPKDIIVMAPDIEKYAPYINAVFDVRSNDSRRIPFSIADQTIRQESRLIDAFLSLLDLKDSRLAATQILRLLEFAPIRQTFGFSDADVQMLEHWVGNTQIRWGRGAGDRIKFDLPGFAENTWEYGLDRLFLGYAMPGYHRDMFGGILPYDDIEGHDAGILGNMAEFLKRVFRCVEVLELPRTLKQWKESLHNILEQFFLPDQDTERDRQSLRKIFDEIAERQDQTELDQKLDFDIIREYLDHRLDQNSFGSGFMSRGVTFCSMLPMRSIPFKVIGLVGMDVDAFPRDMQPLSFDMMAREPKLGDRSRRNDDKYLFLESIISARQKLYISYVGQSIQDNSKIPPSVLVSELLDVVESDFHLAHRPIRDHVITHHRLQAFAPHYFQEESKLFSYSEDNFMASNQRPDGRDTDAFIPEKLAMSETELEEWKTIDIDTLCVFYSHPIRFLLEKRLGIFFGSRASVTEDQENFELTALQRYTIEQNLVNSRLNGIQLADYRPIQRGLGQLPPGRVGDYIYDEMSMGAERFVRQVEEYSRDKIDYPFDFEYELSGVMLRGRLPDVYAPGYVHMRYAKRKAKDLLKVWLHHLIYCDLKPDEFPDNSILICKDKIEKFNRPSNPRKIMKALLNLYLQGMMKPIHFFPETSLVYIQQIQNPKKTRKDALSSAKFKWDGGGYDYNFAEGADLYYQRCLGNLDPIDETYEEIAKQVYEPLLAHLETI
ncbi:MAG: exodeoxyribonuclease V subunit gamma [Deltaproteobacteria bacterium]|jgi:exodeoxyribonuclease V gamma subunit|nr:exodeoxyribonuclease V subunit gamma [Deltaproteobacteria bacterium]